MEHQPPHAPDNEPLGPDSERLDASEIDLTGIVRQDDSLADVIGDALVSAEADGTLPEWGARTIARALANQQDDKASALHQYAVTGRIDQERITTELTAIYSFLPEQSEMRTWTDWLTRYVTTLAETSPDWIDAWAATTPDAQVSEALQRHGDAFRAFLQLSDIDLQQNDLNSKFEEVYVGTYPSMADLLDKLADMRNGMAAINSVAEDWGLDDFVTLDTTGLAEAARAAWDILEYRGRLHVFLR